jgi:superfamily II DNA/RNA helicase
MLVRLTSAGTGKRRPRSPRGLIVVPTRELAGQVSDVLRPLAGALSMRVVPVYGGAAIGRQISELNRQADIVVATPGRLIDLMERNAVTLSRVEVAVLDEADHMSDLGFLPAVTRILDATPDQRQLMLFSATLDRGVGTLASRYLREPAIHAVAAAVSPVATMAHRVFVLRTEDKLAVATEIARRPSRTLFFVRTKHGADRLARQLVKAGVQASAIHGNLNQNQRQRALDAFTAGRIPTLVATDVAARGLHVDDLDLVVHFDPPADAKTYLHRSGRTARAGASGTVLSLVDRSQVRDVAKLHVDAAVTPTTDPVKAGDPRIQDLVTPAARRAS